MSEQADTAGRPRQRPAGSDRAVLRHGDSAQSGAMRRLPVSLIALIALICGLAAAGSLASDLPRSVERVLSAHRISADDVSIIVQPTGAGRPILSHLPDIRRNPASVMKLVSTYAALESLGPAYTWPTEVYFLGDFDGRRLRGDLGLKGHGDPYLVVEEFWKLLRALRREGLETIDGALHIDDSYFDVAEPPPGTFDGQPWRSYNVLPNALLTNFGAVQFDFRYDAREDAVRIATDPPNANLVIRNRIEPAEGPCRGFQAGISFHVVDPIAASEVVFGGRFPRLCGRYAMTRAVLEPHTYVHGLFRALWEETGGSISGGTVRSPIPVGAVPVLTWESRPLAEVIRAINKNSNNVMTRQLLYTLGAERLGAPGTRAKGISTVSEFLTDRGLDISSLVIENGAGLSRAERISAQLLTDMLRLAHRSVYAPEFIASLSLGGLDGTTRRRFNGHETVGAMHVKTGSLDDVAALAGYVHAGEGSSYTVVILVNAPNAHRGPGEELQDALLEWIFSRRE
jgi:serine-type D-Ala-D-Ala carboxypeptidase/endopeptidase (penicillin-binding protein 4)